MRQGSHLLSAVSLTLAGTPQTVHFPMGLSVISQTCDLARTDRDFVQIAVHVVLHGEDLVNYGYSRSPRFHSVDGPIHVDFDQVWTVSKAELEMAGLIELSLESERAVRMAVARKFGRLALPTHVERAMTSLRDYILDKVKKTSSQPAMMLSRISEIRVAIEPDWSESSDKSEVRLTLLLEPGDLFTYEPPGDSASIVSLRHTIAAQAEQSPKATLTQLSAIMTTLSPGSFEDSLVWDAVCVQIAKLVRAKADAATDSPHIGEVSVEVMGKNEYTIAEAENSERLDLAHLSGSDDLT